MNGAKDGENNQPDRDKMEVRDQKVGVVRLPIERRHRVADSRKAGRNKLHDRGDAKQHRGAEPNLAANHRGRPVKHLYPGGDGDQHRGDRRRRDRPIVPMPVVNIWCAQTPMLRMAIITLDPATNS